MVLTHFNASKSTIAVRAGVNCLSLCAPDRGLAKIYP